MIYESWQGFLDLDVPADRYIVEPIIPLGGDVILYGATGVGKSLAAMTIAASVAHGAPLWDRFRTSEGPVLYIQLDMPLWEWQERLASTGDRFPPDALRNRFSILHFDKGEFDILRLTKEQRETVHQALVETEPVLVVMDVIADAHTLNEIEGSTPKRYYRACRSLFGPDTAILHVHHERKSSTNPEQRGDPKHAASGHHSWVDPCSCALRINDAKGLPDGVWINFAKNPRNREPLASIPAVRHGGWIEAAPVDRRKERARELLALGLAQADAVRALEDEFGISRATAYRIVSREEEVSDENEPKTDV